MTNVPNTEADNTTVVEASGLRKLWHKLMTSNSLIITYLRSIVSSQAASWVDYIVRFALFSLGALDAFWSVACGAFCGGVVNCIINYRFTFRAENCDWRAVVVKYAVVWLGSMLLNSYGSEALYKFVSGLAWVQHIGIKDNIVFLATTLFVSLMVSWFWNFALQRYVVYRPMPFDKYIIRLLGGKSKEQNK
ncbi:MAG: GtrA family protein [Muribaculaceae bacterium]|nr:GtrA family protein [Muribaculaceae bacterium]